MLIVRKFYKQFSEKFFDKQILSAKAYLAHIAIEALFYRFKNVTPTMKCLSDGHKTNQAIIPKKPTETWNSEQECMTQSFGLPFYLDKNTKACKRTPYNGKILSDTTKNVQNIFIHFGGSTKLLELNGEMIKSNDQKTYLPALPYFNHLDYSFCDNIKFSHGFPFRTHVFNGGRITPIFSQFKEFEKLYESVSDGYRLDSAYMRLEEVTSDIPIGFFELFLDYPEKFGELEVIRTSNRKFLPTTIDFGKFSWLYDINPKNLSYDTYHHFEIPVGLNGDCYKRYFCWSEEMGQSISFIDQYSIKMSESHIRADEHKIFPLKTCEMKTLRGDRTLRFKYLTSGLLIPPGQILTAIQLPLGKFGVYLIK